jgi:hypothetical protein
LRRADAATLIEINSSECSAARDDGASDVPG